MTPSQRAKELGCRSLAQVIKYSEVPERTLHDYFRTKPKLFDACCIYTREAKYGKIEIYLTKPTPTHCSNVQNPQ